NDELVKAITEGDLLQVLLSELSGECNMNSLYVFKDKKGYDWKATPLIAAAALGHTELVQGFIDRADIDETALYKAAEKGQVAVVRELLEHPDINVNLPNDRNQTALGKAAQYGNIGVIQLLLDHGADPSILDKVIPGTKLFPANGNIAARDSHSFSWSTFLDSHVPVDSSVRVAVVATLLGSEKDGDDWVRELATAKDQHGREALHTTDAATRDLLNGLRFFCGRYELFDGPPIHVSATAVVVNAYDHGVFRQVFEQFANDCGELDKKGFQACGRLLGQQPTDVKK
ncbi:hypothetical protein DYB25_011548, partial [Aphanomyces astaci]